MTKRKSPQDKLRLRFSKFAALINDIAELPKLSQNFVEEIEFATQCMGMILFQQDARYKEMREAESLKAREELTKLGNEVEGE